ncbi:Biotin--acetyl-CoA-carboxylase ligase [Sulfurimonas denitrificans DSM 1251]|uniref:Biotin--acetyl-CoA-carboxylase ligase n=1 Tax=Sulfurimonas denitrificans (strain ATCC 33889 / DSM 1251) TaxID=326298 RepID=Q30QP3_SULDN|nr:biotin--[acetyl-CoA-carboxylase] ligase [Sulfurimonas denitrificans]ABB44688.1 Biotin--acetyl-CoA-carboxylase ligase [Sulfurimonas denitrificans DSM 1251]MDD3442834.1 biotin--[acetyl-CoA-carboxylase] ligase [Sulfurimonas denitrificans]
MQILYLECVDSTQKYLKELILKEEVSLPYAVVADVQTDGVGSRDNKWDSIKNNLFLSFAIPFSELPTDLKLESASIYFSYILKETLEELGSKIWLKWPNDLYICEKKIGGMITNIVKDNVVCGVGLNIVESPEGFTKLDIVLKRDFLLERYFINIKKKSLWKQVFSKYKLEFDKNQNFYTHDKNLIISLGNVTLQDDGSIVINGERIYSRR